MNAAGEISEQTRYLGGLGLHAQQAVTAGPPGPLDTVYLHGDLVGSTVLLTDAAGMPVGSQAYTAFGEAVRLDGGGGGGGPAQPRFGGRWKLTTGDLDGDGTAEWSGTRYAYCGAWGYESGLLELAGADSSLPPIELIHVGARWYDPALGRFVQRDPIGIWGNLNTYLYPLSPLASIDPDGLQSLIPPRHLQVPPRAPRQTVYTPDTPWGDGPNSPETLSEAAHDVLANLGILPTRGQRRPSRPPNPCWDCFDRYPGYGCVGHFRAGPPLRRSEPANAQHNTPPTPPRRGPNIYEHKWR